LKLRRVRAPKQNLRTEKGGKGEQGKRNVPRDGGEKEQRRFPGGWQFQNGFKVLTRKKERAHIALVGTSERVTATRLAGVLHQVIAVENLRQALAENSKTSTTSTS